MNRRHFLSALTTLAVGAAAAAVDPERLLWTPGARTFFLPPARRALDGPFCLSPAMMKALAEANRDLFNGPGRWL